MSAYLVGKWLSNFLVLVTIVATPAGAAVILHVLVAEGPRLHGWALLPSMFWLALPAKAVVAAFAIRAVIDGDLWSLAGWAAGVVFIPFSNQHRRASDRGNGRGDERMARGPICYDGGHRPDPDSQREVMHRGRPPEGLVR